MSKYIFTNFNFFAIISLSRISIRQIRPQKIRSITKIPIFLFFVVGLLSLYIITELKVPFLSMFLTGTSKETRISGILQISFLKFVICSIRPIISPINISAVSS
uniref:Uncharacterized protein n=1 Tax=Cucumis sativus TaxID=3659 RepID=A0A0A0KP04_CUCSA